MSHGDTRRGMALGDALLVLSLLVLASALAYPRIQRAALREQVDQAVANVQALADAAQRYQVEPNGWPDPPDTAESPIDLATYLPEGFSFHQAAYRLDLDVWETAQEAPPMELPDTPPNGVPEALPDTVDAAPTTLFGTLAGVTVTSAEPRLLAGLLDHFGRGRSFLLGTTWTLVFASVPGR